MQHVGQIITLSISSVIGLFLILHICKVIINWIPEETNTLVTSLVLLTVIALIMLFTVMSMKGSKKKLQ